MKRLLVFLLALNTALFPASCTRSKEARTLDDVIASIGEVTLASEDVILDAEAQFNALSEEDQAALKNTELLREAREALDTLKAEARDQENRASLSGEWTELSDALPLQRSIISWFGKLKLLEDGSYSSDTASDVWEISPDCREIVLRGRRGRTTLDVVEDGEYTKLVARELPLTFIRSSEIHDYVEDRFVIVKLSSENVRDYFEDPVCVGEILDEKKKPTGEKAWIQPSSAYASGLVYYGQGSDFHYVLRQTADNGVRRVLLPYDTLPLADWATFGHVAEVSGTVIYVKSEYVAENRMTDARTRQLTFTDGTTHTTSLTWYSDLADYDEWKI